MSKNFHAYFIHINFFEKPNKKIYIRAKEVYCDATIFFLFFIVYLPKRKWKLKNGLRLPTLPYRKIFFFQSWIQVTKNTGTADKIKNTEEQYIDIVKSERIIGKLCSHGKILPQTGLNRKATNHRYIYIVYTYSIYRIYRGYLPRKCTGKSWYDSAQCRSHSGFGIILLILSLLLFLLLFLRPRVTPIARIISSIICIIWCCDWTKFR